MYPQGVSLIKKEFLVIPQKWKNFFETDKISFNGLADSNPFISYLIRYFAQCENTSKDGPTLWSKLMTGSIDISGTNSFTEQWHESLMKDWPDFCDKKGYPLDCYTRPGTDPKA